MSFCSDEEDVHQCGRCKDIFRSLQLYMQHKASKVCKVPKSQPPVKKVETVQSTPAPKEEPNKKQETQTIKSSNILEEAAKYTIYKQLEILAVDEEQERETHSTVDVQSISDQAASYVALQQKPDQGKINAPIIVGVDSKKGKLVS